MNPRVSIAAAALALTACQPTTQTSTDPSTGAASTSVATATVVTPSGDMAAQLNSQRAAQGLGAVRENARLSAAAQAHAQDMAAQGYFSHTGANGSAFTDRARAAGYGCAIAENIAAGQRSEAEVVAGWMTSTGHRRNILQARASEFGIGRAGNTWVLMMGRGC